jgi:hypothetical protein
MALEVINVGAAPNDGQGDPIRTAYIKCNNNFAQLFALPQPSIPASPVGITGDVAGMYAADETHFYYCFRDFDGSSEIWRQIAGSSF